MALEQVSCLVTMVMHCHAHTFDCIVVNDIHEANAHPYIVQGVFYYQLLSFDVYIIHTHSVHQCIVVTGRRHCITHYNS